MWRHVNGCEYRTSGHHSGMADVRHPSGVIPWAPCRALKHFADRVVALGLLTVIVGPLLVIGMLVSLTSSGAPLFVQRRIGRGGAHFSMLKIRSMVMDAEARIHEVRHLHVRDVESAGVLFKARADPRVTPIGHVLRRWSLDELPQIINVVKGEMSLVGPRPALPDEVQLYAPGMLRRLTVRPGITGLWQVSGRSELSVEESTRLDLWYVDNWSLRLDMKILVRTATAVLRRTGAY